MMAVRTPRLVSASTASSDAARGKTFGLRGGSVSVEGVPGALACAMAVPEVTMNGLLEPARTSPMALMAFRSVSQFLTNCEKS